MTAFSPKTGLPCTCRPGQERDNCPNCEGTGQAIDFAAIHQQAGLDRLRKQLDPNRFPGMSPKMGAIVGVILDTTYTEPRLVALIVTIDGGVLGMDAGDIGYNTWIGSFEDLRRNWTNLLAAAGLTDADLALAENLFRAKVRLAGVDYANARRGK